MRERTKGVSGKGLNFPREALSEREREREREHIEAGFREEKSLFFLLSSTGQLPTGPTADSIKRKVVKELP